MGEWRKTGKVYIVFVEGDYGEEIEGVYWRLDVAEESIRQSKECHNDTRNFRIEKQDVWSK